MRIFIQQFFCVAMVGLLMVACGSAPERSLNNQKALDKISNLDSCIFYASKSLESLVPKDQYYSHFLLGYAYDEKQQYQKAVKHYVESLNLIPPGDEYSKDRTSLYKNLGRIFKIHREFGLATNFYERALKLVSNDRKSLLLLNLGNLYKESGQEEKAVKTYFEGLELAKGFDQFTTQAKLYNNLAVVLIRIEEFEEAKEYLFEVILNTEIEGYQKQAGKAYHNVGHINLVKNNYQKAIEYYHKALETYKLDESFRFLTYKDLGICYSKLGSPNTAMVYLDSAESLYADVEKKPQYIEVFRIREHICRDLGLVDERELYDYKYDNEMSNFILNRENLLSEANSANIELYYAMSEQNELFIYKLSKKQFWIYISLTVIAIVSILLLLQLRKARKVRVDFSGVIGKFKP